MKPAKQLALWIAQRHAGQRIKRSSEPYLNHLLAVAKLSKHAAYLGYEIGLCHDLLEDTDTDTDTLGKALLSFGYDEIQMDHIVTCVLELTDVYTSEAYPDLSKKQRKHEEQKRLATIGVDAQTVKYADLIYNVGWVLTYDRKHAKRYLKKKLRLLNTLTKGDQLLRRTALNLIAASIVRVED